MRCESFWKLVDVLIEMDFAACLCQTMTKRRTSFQCLAGILSHNGYVVARVPSASREYTRDDSFLVVYRGHPGRHPLIAQRVGSSPIVVLNYF